MTTDTEEILKGSLKVGIEALTTVSFLIKHCSDPALAQEYAESRLHLLQKIEEYVSNATP